MNCLRMRVVSSALDGTRQTHDGTDAGYETSEEVFYTDRRARTMSLGRAAELTGEGPAH